MTERERFEVWFYKQPSFRVDDFEPAWMAWQAAVEEPARELQALREKVAKEQ